jgi:hypothetical protein
MLFKPLTFSAVFPFFSYKTGDIEQIPNPNPLGPDPVSSLLKTSPLTPYRYFLVRTLAVLYGASISIPTSSTTCVPGRMTAASPYGTPGSPPNLSGLFQPVLWIFISFNADPDPAF